MGSIPELTPLQSTLMVDVDKVVNEICIPIGVFWAGLITSTGRLRAIPDFAVTRMVYATPVWRPVIVAEVFAETPSLKVLHIEPAFEEYSMR